MNKILILENEISNVILQLKNNMTISYDEILLALQLAENRLHKMKDAEIAYIAADNEKANKESEDQKNENKDANE